MRILALGDVFGMEAVKYVASRLPAFCGKNRIDITVANGENASGASGAEPEAVSALLSGGCDVLTGGNHSFGRKSLYSFLDAHENVLRPANYPAGTPGSGYTTVRAADGTRVLFVSLRGNLGFDSLPLACPFDTLEAILRREAGSYDYSVVDFHAEYTSEKLAMGTAFDGKVNVLFGTHTHIPTADNRVLPLGTGYVTDLGMCGPVNSILGVESAAVISRMRTKLPAKFETAGGPVQADGVIFELAPDGRCVSAERVRF